MFISYRKCFGHLDNSLQELYFGLLMVAQETLGLRAYYIMVPVNQNTYLDREVGGFDCDSIVQLSFYG